MNRYIRAFKAIDAVLSWNFYTLARNTEQERMAAIDREIEKLQGYMDSRRAQLEAQLLDPRMLEIPVSRDDALDYSDYDGAQEADQSGHDRDDKRMMTALFGLGVIAGFLAACLLLLVVIPR